MYITRGDKVYVAYIEYTGIKARGLTLMCGVYTTLEKAKSVAEFAAFMRTEPAKVLGVNVEPIVREMELEVVPFASFKE